MIFFLKADGTLIKSAPDTVYQGSAEAGKIYVVAPLNAGMLVDVYYELPNGERWGAYLLENNGKVIDDADLPEGWALWSTSLASAITQYAGTLKAQFGFYQSGTADKVPLITSQAVAITIAKGVVRDLPEAPTTDVYEQILNALSSIKQDIANLPNEYLANTNEDKIALKNNKSIPYEKDVSGSTIVQRDEAGRIKALRGENENDVVNVSQLDERAKTFRYVGGPDEFTDVNGGLTVKKGMNVDGPMKANTAPKADNEVVRLQELKEAEIKDLGAISDIDLNTGDTKVEYDTELGITIRAKGTVTRKNGNAEQPTTKFELPIVSGDGIVIDKAQNEEKISVKVDGKVTKTPNSIVKRDSAGRVKTADAVSDEDATSYGQHKALRTYTDSELLKKLDRTGGTITGDLIVSGNLSVGGETSVIESTTLKVADKLIYVAKDNTTALTSPAGLITPKYDGTNDGGLVYDNSGTAYVGDIKLDSKGNVDVNNSDLQPIATRDVYSNFTNGHKVKAEVDSSQKNVKFIDGGEDDGINSLTDVNLTLSDTTVQYDTTNGIQITSTGRFTYAGGNHDATIDLDLPIIGTNGIVIDKAADSEKIEISGKNLIKDPYPGVNNTGADIVNYKPYGSSDWGSAFVRNTHSLVNNAYSGSLVGYDNNGIIYAKTTSDDPWSVVNKEYADDNYAKSDSTEITDPSPDAIELLPNGYYTLTEKVTTGFTNNLASSYYTIAMFKFSASEGYAIAQDVTNNKMYVASFSSATGTKGWNEIPNKQYVEDNFLKVYDQGIINNGEVKIPVMRRLDETANEQKWFPTCVGEYVANSAIALTDDKGHLGTNTPTAAKHCANKEYVDNVDEEKTLYRHDLRIMRTSTSSVFGYSIYCSFYSSSNLSISSLTDLRTVLGNLFTLMATGYLTGTDANYDPIEAIFQSGVRPIKNTDQTYDNATFSDTVTKII